MGVPSSQEGLSAKNLTQQLGESWVAIRAQSGYKGNEQPRADRAAYRTYSLQESANIQAPRWHQVVKRAPSSQESVEWPGERRTAIKAPNNQGGKEGSKESARRRLVTSRASSDQLLQESVQLSEGRDRGGCSSSTVFMWRRPVIMGESGVVVRAPVSRESGQQTGEK